MAGHFRRERRRNVFWLSLTSPAAFPSRSFAGPGQWHAGAEEAPPLREAGSQRRDRVRFARTSVLFPPTSGLSKNGRSMLTARRECNQKDKGPVSRWTGGQSPPLQSSIPPKAGKIMNAL